MPVRYSGGGGGGSPPGSANVIAPMGTDGESSSQFKGALGPHLLGTDGESMVPIFNSTLPMGTDSEAILVASVVGAGTAALGTDSESITALFGSIALPSIGTDSESALWGATSAVRGFSTGEGTEVNNPAWTGTGNVRADDAAVATWTVSDSLGGGTGTTSEGILRTDAFKIPDTWSLPSGFSRSLVEVLIHRNDAAVGLGATGDTATFTVRLYNNSSPSFPDSLLGTVFTDTFTAAGSNADATVVTDVTTLCSGITEANLHYLRMRLDAKFVRTLAAIGTRSWTVNVNSASLRVTYTRSGIS